MNITQNLKSKDAEMVVDLRCHISWRLPPKNKEEEVLRQQADAVLAKIGFELQEAVGHIILTNVRIQGDL